MTTILKPTSVEDFTNSFLSTPDKITDQPTYGQLKALRETIYANAASVPTTLGGGQHGHLGMTMEAATYASLAPNTPFISPTPVTMPDLENSTGPQIIEANRQYAEDLRAFKSFQNLNQALIKQVTNAVPALYLRAFHRPRIGLLGRTIAELLTWLFQKYGRLTETDIAHNRSRLETAWNPNDESFQVLAERFDDIQEFSIDANDPITDSTLINSCLVALRKTGVLHRPLERWRELPSASRQSWPQCKDFFHDAIADYQTDRSTARTAGYNYGANAMEPGTYDNSYADYVAHQETANAALQNVTSSQIVLAELLAKTTAELKALKMEMANLQKTNRAPLQASKLTSYCWTHGYVVDGHTSETCRKTADGHQRAATKGNQMGGSTRNKPT